MSQAPSDRQPSVDEGQNDKKIKSRRPANTAFRQQRLKAWQPILTPKTVLPLFFALAVVFAPIGGLLIYASAQVEEFVLDYTNCLKTDGTGAPVGNKSDSTSFQAVPAGNYMLNFKTATDPGALPTWVQSNETVFYYRGQVNNTVQPGAFAVPNTGICSIQFQVPDSIGPPVLLYYRLTNFYQNHRRYVQSSDVDQLAGQALDAKTINGSSCTPLTSNGSLPYYPCGLIANSMFNDTFGNPMALNLAGSDDANPVEYVMSDGNIAWPSDAALYGNTSYAPNAIAVPPFWQPRWGPQGYTEENGPPDLNTWPAFQVWMRTAGLPDFSKLALTNETSPLTEGRYQIDIIDNFPAAKYGGTKSVVITTVNVMGGKNPFLGSAYVVVGGIAMILGLLFTAAQLIKPRKLGDHTYLSWNNDQPSSSNNAGGAATTSTATATGVSRPGHDGMA